MKRLEGALSGVELQISDLKKRKDQGSSTASESQLLALRSELLQKSAIYSESHPDMKVLKQRLAALEQAISPKTENGVGLDALERQKEALSKDLEATTQKLATARLGESLERAQQSEKLEVIEQPTLPQMPIKPNRPKAFALAFVAAVMSAGGLVAALEFLASTIRQPADVFRMVDSHLVVVIPYITTHADIRRRNRRRVMIIIFTVVALIVMIAALAIAFYWRDELLLAIENLRSRMIFW
jgi:hypothetical protein